MTTFKISSFAAFFVIQFGIILCSCTPSEPIVPTFDERLLLKTWYLDITQTGLSSDSFKQFYVAEGQPLPPARGRTGMIFEKDGKYTYIGIAPADGPLLFEGAWKWVGSTQLLVQYAGKSYQGATFPSSADTLDILSLSSTELVVRRKPR